MKRNKLKYLIKKVLKEQLADPGGPDDDVLDPIGKDPLFYRPPNVGPPTGPGNAPSNEEEDKGAHTGKVNLGIWKIISATPNYSGQTPQNRYSTTCPPRKGIGTLINKNKFKSIARSKYKRRKK